MSHKPRLKCVPSEVYVGGQPRLPKPPPEPPKPILLAKSRIDRVVNNAFNASDIQVRSHIEEQKARNEQIKKGSDELIKLFTMNMQRTQAQKKAQRAAFLNAKYESARISTEVFAAQDEKIRQERLMKAQQLLEKLKPGPQALHSAALHSEVLRVRGIQQEIKKQFEILQEQALKKECDQYNPRFWERDELGKMEEKKKTDQEYARELTRTVAEKKRREIEERKQRIADEKAVLAKWAELAKIEEELEMAKVEKRKKTCQENFEADMKMKRRYKRQSEMEEEILKRQICVYEAGKNYVNKKRKDMQDAVQGERIKKMDANLKRYIKYAKQIEDKKTGLCTQNEVNCLTAKHLEKEEAEKQKEKRLKEERIAAHMQAMAEDREKRRLEAEAKRFELAQRLKNEEINCLFTQAQMAARAKKAEEARAKRNMQMLEDMQLRASVPAAPDCTSLRVDKEDKFFFEYAHNLVQDAVTKQRPLYPFARAIKQYKRHNNFNCGKKVPAHMVTHINVGRSAAENKETDPCYKPKESSKLTVAKEMALANCLKVEEIIAANEKQVKNVCNTPAPIVCFTKGRGRPKNGLETDIFDGMPKCDCDCSEKPEPTGNLTPVTNCNS